MMPVTANVAASTSTKVPHRLGVAVGVVLAVAAGVLMRGGHSAWAVLLLLAVAPLLEEVVFRAGLQEWLLRQRIQPLASTVASAMAFALMHGFTRSWLLAAWVFVPALVLGALYARQRSLAPVVLLHSAMNLVWLWSGPAWTGLFTTTSS